MDADRRSRHWLTIIVFAACCALQCGMAGPAWARQPPLETIAADSLPHEAREMLALIARRGPYAYERDGVVFNNRERILPVQPRGYYHEFTVQTPGVRGRGARRLVCGGGPRSVDECYYSPDHYRTFKRIR